MASYADTQRTSLSPAVRLMIKNMTEAFTVMPYSFKEVLTIPAVAGEGESRQIIGYIQEDEKMLISLNPLACIFGYYLSIKNDADPEAARVSINRMSEIVTGSSSSDEDDIGDYIFTYLTGNKQNIKSILIRYKDFWSYLRRGSGAAAGPPPPVEAEEGSDDSDDGFNDDDDDEMSDYGDDMDDGDDY